jgi:hypothetical protein
VNPAALRFSGSLSEALGESQQSRPLARFDGRPRFTFEEIGLVLEI